MEKSDADLVKISELPNSKLSTISEIPIVHNRSSHPLPDSVHGVPSGISSGTDYLNGKKIKDTPYRVGRKIGSGSFGYVHFVRHITTNEKLAVKLETKKVSRPQLANEWEIYNILNKTSAPGVPKAYYYGPFGTHYALVLDLLGPSLEQVFKMCSNSFPVQVVLMIAVEMIDRIECLHSRHILHRDIKPDNLLTCHPLVCDNTIFFVDFGLSKRYFDPVTEQHIPYKKRCTKAGTPRYMSLNAHMGIEMSRRDDLETIGYVLIYFLRGSLPWQGCCHSFPAGKDNFILDMKKTMTLEELCDGHPAEFVQFMKYARSLDFYETPNYNFVRNLFRSRLEKEGYSQDIDIEWLSILGNHKLMRELQHLHI